MKKILTIVIALCGIYNITFSQTYCTTSSGQKIILNSDGTWKYLNEEESESSLKECQKYEYGSIKITNNRHEEIRVHIRYVKKLVNNPAYGEISNNNKEKKIWKTDDESLTIPAGETKIIYNVMSGAYTYKAKKLSMDLSSGDVNVQPCNQEIIKIN